MPGVKALRRIQMGKETTGASGTAVAATTTWRGLGTIQDGSLVVFPNEDVGLLVPTDRSYVPKVSGELSFEAVEATFEQIPYLFEAGVKLVTPTTDTGSGFIYTYDLPSSAQPEIRTFTIEGGDDNQAERFAYGFVKSLNLTGNAGEALMMSAEWMGRQVANNAFTASSDAAIPSVDEILFSKGKLYIDNDTDSFGTTLKSNTFLGLNLTYTTGLFEVFAADGNLYFSTHKMTRPELTMDITFEHDATSVAEKTAWRAETARLVRLLFQGPALTTTGTYDVKTLILDVAGKWESFDKIGEKDGNDIIVAHFRGGYNATAAKMGTFTVVNELSSLP